MLFVHPLGPKVRDAICGDGLTARFEVIWFPDGKCQFTVIRLAFPNFVVSGGRKERS
jgi:hypothetical protein